MKETVWMISHPNSGFWYSPPATNASQAWSNACEWEQWITGGQSIVGWEETMKKQGWRAKRVVVEIPVDQHKASRDAKDTKG